MWSSDLATRGCASGGKLAWIVGRWRGDPGCRCRSRSARLRSGRAYRSGRWRLGLVCIVGMCGRRWRQRCRRRRHRRGRSGTGKTHLLIGLGLAACQVGRRARYAPPTNWSTTRRSRRRTTPVQNRHPHELDRTFESMRETAPTSRPAPRSAQYTTHPQRARPAALNLSPRSSIASRTATHEGHPVPNRTRHRTRRTTS